MEQTSSASSIGSPIQAARNALRVNGFAVIDFAATFAGTLLLTRLMEQRPYKALAMVLPISIAVHTLIGIDTPLNTQFFDMDAFFGVKILTFLSVMFLIN